MHDVWYGSMSASNEQQPVALGCTPQSVLQPPTNAARATMHSAKRVTCHLKRQQRPLTQHGDHQLQVHARSIWRGCARPNCAVRTPWRWMPCLGPSCNRLSTQHELPCAWPNVSLVAQTSCRHTPRAPATRRSIEPRRLLASEMGGLRCMALGSTSQAASPR